jgi:HSP20 family protein
VLTIKRNYGGTTMMMTYSLLNDALNFTNSFDLLFKRIPEGVQGRVSFSYIDVYENGDIVEIRALVPGIGADSLKVEIADNTLLIEGERKYENERGKYLRREREYGQFRKTVTLPYPVNGEAVNASVRDGILSITLEKREDVKPRKIAIQ